MALCAAVSPALYGLSAKQQTAMSMVRMTRNRFATSRVRSQMRCFSWVVEIVAARPRATLRVGIDSSAAGVKEPVFWGLSASPVTAMLADFLAFESTVASIEVSHWPKSGDSGDGVFVYRRAGLGSFGVVFMFIGFTVGFFEAAKSDVFSR